MTTTSLTGAPLRPSSEDFLFVPDRLIAGDLKLVTDTVTLTGAAALARGALLGKVTATGAYKLSLAAAADGSQNPCAILVDNTDATAGDVATSVYLMGEFNPACMTFGAGHTAASVKDALRAFGIFLKDALSAADPT